MYTLETKGLFAGICKLHITAMYMWEDEWKLFAVTN